MSNQSVITLVPLEVNRLIIKHLTPVDPIFVPRYHSHRWPAGHCYIHSRCFGGGDLNLKHKEYYGPRNAGQDAAADALLNLSSTCQFYRQLTAPVIFHTIVLRAKPKSIASVQALRSTGHWRYVEKLIYAGTFITPQTDEHHDFKYWPDPLEEIDMAELSDVLSHLPPNMSELVLDFPSGWVSKVRPNYSMFDHQETPEEIGQSERSKTYRTMLNTTFDALCNNAMTSKQSHALQINNMPPFECSVFGSEHFRQYLGMLNSFRIGFCNYECSGDMTMARQLAASWITPKLSTMFFNHLESVQTFSLDADVSWPMGEANRDFPQLSLPTAIQLGMGMARLRHVHFTYIYINQVMIDFLVARAQTLESVHLKACGAQGGDNSTDLRWQHLFAALVAARPMNLTSFEVQLPENKRLDDLLREEGFGSFEDMSDTADIHAHVYDSDDSSMVTWRDVARVLDRQEAILARLELTNHAEHERRCERRRQVFPYIYIDHNRREETWDDPWRNIFNFLDKIDHRAWIELVDLMDGNRKRLRGLEKVEV